MISTSVTAHRGYVRAVGLVDADGESFIVSGGFDGRLVASSQDALVPISAVTAHREGLGTLITRRRAGEVFTGGGDGVVRRWLFRARRFELVAEHPLPITSPSPLVEALGVAPDGARIAAGAVDGTCFLIEGTGLRRLSELAFISINALVFTPDGLHLFVASDLCCVHLLRLSDGEEVWTSAPFDDHVDGLTLQRSSVDEYILGAVTHGNAIWRLRMTDLPPRAVSVERVAAGRAALNSIVRIDGGGLVAGGDDRTVFQLLEPAGAGPMVVAKLPRDIDGLCVVNDDRIAVATTAGLHLVSREEGRVLATSQRTGALAAISACDGLVAVGLHDATRLVVAETGALPDAPRRVCEVSAPVSCGAGSAHIFGLADGSIVELEGEAIRLIARAAAEVESVCTLAMPEGRAVAAVDRSGTLTLVGPDRITRSIAVSRSGDRLKTLLPGRVGGRDVLLTAGKDRRLYVVDIESLTVTELPWDHGATRTLNGLAMAGDRIFAASWDACIYVGDLQSNGIVSSRAALTGHTQACESIIVVGTTLVSTAYDGSCRMWDIEGLTPIGNVSLSSMAVRRACLSETRGRLWTAGYDGVAREVAVNSGVVTLTWAVYP